MPRPRYAQVSLASTPYYHCISRCVRRAFLCGFDEYTGKDYEHRRQKIEDRILKLGGIFAIDIAGYAVMSNHYHVVLHVDKARAEAWDTLEVIERWHRVFKGKLLSQRYIKGETLERAELDKLNEMVKEWRARLYDLSWFMRCINEPTARQANFEDQCSGRFWEGRYISQGLLDEAALIAGLAYVDLNPIRAKMAETPEESAHTTIKRRAEAVKQVREQTDVGQRASVDLSDPLHQPKQLFPFVGNPREEMPKGLPFRVDDYLDLVDWTGRQFRTGKGGAIASDQPAIMKRLHIEPEQWLQLSMGFEKLFKSYVGSEHRLRKTYQVLGYQRTPGLVASQQLLA